MAFSAVAQDAVVSPETLLREWGTDKSVLIIREGRVVQWRGMSRPDLPSVEEQRAALSKHVQADAAAAVAAKHAADTNAARLDKAADEIRSKLGLTAEQWADLLKIIQRSMETK